MNRLALALLVLGCGKAEPEVSSPTATVPLGPSTPPLTSTVGGPDFTAVFRQVSPGVVSIAAGRKKDGRFRLERTGTGLAWDATHVVTNDHLVGDASDIRVQTVDGRILRAKLVANDGLTDVAVLAVPKSGLTPLPRGLAQDLVPGQWVAAIGNPHGMSHSITVGVVSALERRKLPGAPRYGAFVQTDLNINPGNSGGPLVDEHGRVVGINTLIMADAAGISFATPIEHVETVVTALLTEGRFNRGFAGLFVKPVSGRAARHANLPDTSGARVSGVVAEGPAAKAGIQPGDVILRYGADMVDDSDALPWLIATTKPGQTVPLEVARGAARHTLQMKVAAAD